MKLMRRSSLPSCCPGGRSGLRTCPVAWQQRLLARRSRHVLLPLAVAAALEPETATVPRVARAGPVSGTLLQDHLSALDSQYTEYDYFVDPAWVNGVIPPELEGTLFTIGPGATQLFGQAVRNPADADGMVASWAFEGGRVFFRNKFVRTKTFASEQLMGRRISRGIHDKGSGKVASGPLGSLSGLFNPLDLSFRAAANANVVYWGGKLLAMSDASLPYEVNKISLDTLGEHNVSGAFADMGKLAPGFKMVTNTQGEQRLVLMGATQSGPDSLVRFVELGKAGQVVGQQQYRVSNSLARMLSDFLVIDGHYILLQGPVSFNTQRFMTRYTVGEVSFAECIDFDPDVPSRLHLIPRATNSTLQPPIKGSAVTVMDAPPMVSSDAVNAYQLDGGRRLVVDVVAQEGLHFHKDLMTEAVPGYYRGQPKPELTRLVIDTASGSVTSTRVLSQRAAGHVCYNESAKAGRPHRFLYSAGPACDDVQNWGPNQVITKASVPPTYSVEGLSTGRNMREGLGSEVWAPGDRFFVGPPTFIAKPGALHEDGGWLVTLIHNAESKKAELCILDAQRVSQGPVCTIQLPHHLPLPNKAHFTPVYLGPGRGAPKGWKPQGVRLDSD